MWQASLKLKALRDQSVTSPPCLLLTWIGLQVGIPHNLTKVNRKGEVVGFQYGTGCWWPVGVCPRLDDEPDPLNTVDKCNITYDDTFHGQWEDGKLYDEAESVEFWAPDEPSDKRKEYCNGESFVPDEQSRAYCERGVNGKPDYRQHCAQILPADEKQIQIEGEVRKGTQFAGKWTDYWFWIKSRGYICERPAMRSGVSEDNTAPTATFGE
ncbi:hypothetical protein AAVH_39304, partial [Aphelenchoides avenae]